jgi:precorrin-6Y C5,15-methyltransferase (decarboxylating)
VKYLRDPDEIYRQSFAVIAAECDLSRFVPGARAIAVRMIHACGMTDLAPDIRIEPNFPAAVEQAVSNGRPVFTDCEMVRSAIAASHPASGEVICTLNDTLVNQHGVEHRTTRSAAAVNLWVPRLDGAVAVIGNAPTALFALLEIIDGGGPRPAAIIATPVGFVGAEEAKAELARHSRGIPFVTVLGRRGGSAMAAAAFNAVISRRMPRPDVQNAVPRARPGEDSTNSAFLGLEPRTRLGSISYSDQHCLVPRAKPAKPEEDSRGNRDTHATPVQGDRSQVRKPWLTVVGMGEDGLDGLAPGARRAIDEAAVLIGSERLLAYVPENGSERVRWPEPFSELVHHIMRYRGRDTVVLATGDPLNYGVARKLMELVPASEVAVLPGISAFSLAAARMGWSLPDTDTLTLHGRPACGIEPYIQPGARLIVLTTDETTIHEVARRLAARGYGASTVTVLENMGGPRERRLSFRADSCPGAPFSRLNTLAVECMAAPAAQVLPRSPGLPDDAFLHDGQITKREVRAVTLAALAPTPDALLWDVGAGCGSVAIEWMRSARGTKALAFEKNAERLAMIAGNAEALGTPRIEIVAGHMPATFAGRPAPQAVFLGGAVADDQVFNACWNALAAGGRLVANAVTLEGEASLIQRHASFGGELVRIEVSRVVPLGVFRGMEPRMPVTQWRVTKP